MSEIQYIVQDCTALYCEVYYCVLLIGVDKILETVEMPFSLRPPIITTPLTTDSKMAPWLKWHLSDPKNVTWPEMIFLQHSCTVLIVEVYIIVPILACLQPLLIVKLWLSFFPHQKIIITFQANEIHCFVEMAVRLGKLYSQLLEVTGYNNPCMNASFYAFTLPNSVNRWMGCFLLSFTDSVFVAGSVQRGSLASEWEGTQTMITPALTHLVGPSSLCLDWWHRITGKTFTSR